MDRYIFLKQSRDSLCLNYFRKCRWENRLLCSGQHNRL